ncbi:stage II sporulation protein D-like protein [Fibrobacter succinogenes subsp. succinogenes S85]|uniref:Stage II sporulation protein D-like protein n=1 Tax=Fibrobacter succinogenes (strain ATCC 19169 / S85) TaxID=59374 RepID=D9S7J1_FIBSS|nr:SpoIID/LytB domain-containing protein [Fibrobacter succinogenes]ADL26792.1 stage II sporulation protein D-like protein [Fibrobacter succinogenes subsp. succinogenes S85]
MTTLSLATSSLAAGNSEYSPIEANSVSEQTIVPQKIKKELNRPIQVGVFVGVPNIFVRQKNEELHITASKGKLKIKTKSKRQQTADRRVFKATGSSASDCIAIATDKAGLNKACYNGEFIVTANGNKLNAINVIDIEDYLRGVVPYEIGKLDESKFEALKAQAVAARTYAYKHFGSRVAQGFDVYADTRDQVYKGLHSATALTDKAVRETEGVVMTYNGEFITAYYHSTCGGETEGVVTWGRPDHPYLKNKPDLRPDGTPWCRESNYTEWTREFTEDELRDLFQINAKEAKANVPSFSSIKSMHIQDTLKSGRIHTLVIETNNGSFTAKADKIRWLFKRGGTILPSSFFRIHKNGNEWILKGKGFGHGVGLCQMGARARAQAGQSYIQILTHYYPGITLEKFKR